MLRLEGAAAHDRSGAADSDAPQSVVAGRLEGPFGDDGVLDLGVLDVRELLVERRMTLRRAQAASANASDQAVRIGMWNQPPPTGPFGGSVSLGSAQFPEWMLGAERAWLVPRGAETLHFLTELPADQGRGLEWRSGKQQLFGPFPWNAVPAELRLD